MKRYMVFAYDREYPEGGMNDFLGSFDSIGDARVFIGNFVTDYDYIQIYDQGNREAEPELVSEKEPTIPRDGV